MAVGFGIREMKTHSVGVQMMGEGEDGSAKNCVIVPSFKK